MPAGGATATARALEEPHAGPEPGHCEREPRRERRGREDLRVEGLHARKIAATPLAETGWLRETRRVELPEAARTLVESGALGHLVTLNPDGSPQVTCVWVAVEGGELLTGHLSDRQQKIQNVRRDPRVTFSFEGTAIHPPGLREYLVVHGRARVEPGGAPELLQRLAYVHLGPDVVFPPMDDPPPGFVMRTAIGRIGGIGPWA
jgi:PPOX class probable F420-dependent enzyme